MKIPVLYEKLKKGDYVVYTMDGSIYSGKTAQIIRMYDSHWFQIEVDKGTVFVATVNQLKRKEFTKLERSLL